MQFLNKQYKQATLLSYYLSRGYLSTLTNQTYKLGSFLLIQKITLCRLSCTSFFSLNRDWEIPNQHIINSSFLFSFANFFLSNRGRVFYCMYLYFNKSFIDSAMNDEEFSSLAPQLPLLPDIFAFFILHFSNGYLTLKYTQFLSSLNHV